MDAVHEELLRRLRAGHDSLCDALAGVDEELAKRKPVAGGWSVLECVEHLALAEEYLLSRLKRAERADHSHENLPREARITDRALDRSRPIEAPEMARPHGRFESLADARGFFEKTRLGTVQFLEGFEGDLRCWVTDHPLIPGPVNCYEILLMIAAHPVRHAQQIQERKNNFEPRMDTNAHE